MGQQLISNLKTKLFSEIFYSKVANYTNGESH